MKLPEHLDRILNDKCISHSQLIQAVTNAFLKGKQLYGESEHVLWFAKEVPAQIMVLLRDEQIELSTGESLDAIAKRYEIERAVGQTDADLRVAIKKKAAS